MALGLGLAAGGAAAQEQLIDPGFSAAVVRPAYHGDGPVVSIDEAHLNFHTADGQYRPLAELLRADGYRVERGRAPFTAASLAGIRILIIANPGSPRGADTLRPAFTDAEADAVRVWVLAGGALFLIADHAPFGLAAAPLAADVGVTMGRGWVFVRTAGANRITTQLTFSAANGRLGDHPIMRGREPGEAVRIVQSFTGQSLAGPPGSAALLPLPDEAHEAPDRAALDAAAQAAATGGDAPQRVTAIAPAGGRSQGLAFTLGAGRVVVLGEAAMLSAQIIRYGPASGRPDMRVGMNVPGNDNRQFALNVAHWLSGLLGDSGPQPTAGGARCALPEQRALDFWLGEWRVEWRQRSGLSGRASNSVTRDADGCVIVERFRDETTGLAGIGIYSYFPILGRWTQTWMDNQATTISAVGAPAAEAPGTFVLTLRRGQDPNREYRFTFSDIQRDRFVWRLQSRAAGEAWVDETVSRYVRAREQ